jgi:hypothetical protein
VARFAGISSGSVWNFTRRVITAIRSLTADYVYWPDDEQRRKIAKRFFQKHGLKSCVGIVDGTPVIFLQRPGIDGETFYDRYLYYYMMLGIYVHVFYKPLCSRVVLNWGKSLAFFFSGKAGTRLIYSLSVMTKGESFTTLSGILGVVMMAM